MFLVDTKKEFINQIIKKTLEFEGFVDRIDFNSLKEEDYKDNKTNSGKDVWRQVIQNLYGEVKDSLKSLHGIIKKSNKKYSSFLNELIKAKGKRLEARKQDYRKAEEDIYIESTNILHKEFDKIPVNFFKKKENETLNFYEKLNWLKILYYNEFSIFYSGLAESSMSLGYAERSIELLKKICPDLKKDVATDNDTWEKLWKEKGTRIFIRLYTFALYNKAEAERLRHNYISSLQVFRKIISIYNTVKSKESDYYSACAKTGLILTDQGRGTEAIKCFEKVCKGRQCEDVRIPESKLEIAEAYIDQKEYSKAREILNEYLPNSKNSFNNWWGKTFFRRSAEVTYLRLLNEWEKNKDENSKEFTSYWGKFPKHGSKLLRDCLEPLDGNNFKKTCKYLAEYCNYEREKAKENDKKQTAEKWVKREIDCYCLLSLNDIIFEKEKKECFTQKLQKELKSFIEKLTGENFWTAIHKELKTTKEKLSKEYEKKTENNPINAFITRTEDTKYLEGFFYALNELQEKQRDLTLFENIKEKLVSLYTEKDNLRDASKVEENFERRKEEPEKYEGKKTEDTATKFITDYYFRLKPDSKSLNNTELNPHKYLSPHNIVKQMKKNTDEFTQKIVFPSNSIPLPDTKNGEVCAILTVLRRWNSFTPALADTLNPSKGGGYFLLFKGEKERLGIVIDPGYDFLDNFFSQGFSIRDIDAVLISHCHPDHTNDFPSLLSLFHERNDKLRKYYKKYYKNRNLEEIHKKFLTLVLSEGTYEHYSKSIEQAEESLKDVQVLRSKTKILPLFLEDKEINIKPFVTLHGDLSKKESFGFKIKFGDHSIGYTGDMRWEKPIKELENCNIVIAHLGSIVDILNGKNFCNSFCSKYENDKNNTGKCKKIEECIQNNYEKSDVCVEQFKKQTDEQNHLYLAGMANLFTCLKKSEKGKSGKKKLVIISEFGEELKEGIRMDLFHKFDDWLRGKNAKKKGKNNKEENDRRCLPGDIGLTVDLVNGKILCHCCENYVLPENIEPVPYGQEEAICFVCKECNSVFSQHQISAKLNNYRVNGRPFKQAPTRKDDGI